MAGSRGGGLPGVVGGAWRTARRVATDPRTLGVLQSGPRAAAFLSHAAARTARISDDTIIPVRATAALAAQVWLDELMIAAFRHPRLIPDDRAFAQAAADVSDAHDLMAERGWLADPATYHRKPDAPETVVLRRRSVPGLNYEHVAFPSAWEPYDGEPGRTRWLSYVANRTAHAWVARPARPSDAWVVCVHGFGMGSNPLFDFNAFRATQLVRRGVNVAVVVLPLHGPRSTGKALGEGFMSIDVVDSMHGLSHAAWDVRRVIAWLRASQGAERIGLIGQSLGGHVVALTAGLEPGLSCVIAGIPVVDLVDLFRRHSPPRLSERAAAGGVLGPEADAIHSVVSPLAFPCAVELDGRFVFAGLGDRMATFGHAHRLWLHWDKPRLSTYDGGHVGFFFNGGVRQFVEDALSERGLLQAA